MWYELDDQDSINLSYAIRIYVDGPGGNEHHDIKVEFNNALFTIECGLSERQATLKYKYIMDKLNEMES